MRRRFRRWGDSESRWCEERDHSIGTEANEGNEGRNGLQLPVFVSFVCFCSNPLIPAGLRLITFGCLPDAPQWPITGIQIRKIGLQRANLPVKDQICPLGTKFGHWNTDIACYRATLPVRAPTLVFGTSNLPVGTRTCPPTGNVARWNSEFGHWISDAGSQRPNGRAGRQSPDPAAPVHGRSRANRSKALRPAHGRRRSRVAAPEDGRTPVRLVTRINLHRKGPVCSPPIMLSQRFPEVSRGRHRVHSAA